MCICLDCKLLPVSGREVGTCRIEHLFKADLSEKTMSWYGAT